MKKRNVTEIVENIYLENKALGFLDWMSGHTSAKMEHIPAVAVLQTAKSFHEYLYNG